MGIVAAIIGWALDLFLLCLLGRLVLDLALSVNRSWRPRGFVVVLAEITMTVTDPPLRFLRRFIPMVRIGSLSLDLSFGILWFAVLIVQRLAQSLAG